jgi:hypothetical protein
MAVLSAADDFVDGSIGTANHFGRAGSHASSLSSHLRIGKGHPSQPTCLVVKQ